MDDSDWDIDWKVEPDLQQLHGLYDLLQKDPSKAVPGLEELADRGSVASVLYLANHFMNGSHHVGRDEGKALPWYLKGHELGVPQASYMVGRLKYKLFDYETAFNAFSKGAARGYAPAIYRLAKMYQSGEGVARNPIEYRRLLELAASKKNMFAQRDLAFLLLTGGLGVVSFFRGVALLFGLWANIARFLWMSLRRGPKFGTRTLA